MTTTEGRSQTVQRQETTLDAWRVSCLVAICLVGGALPGAGQPAALFDGIVQSTAGGFEFPDGTVQTNCP